MGEYLLLEICYGKGCMRLAPWYIPEDHINQESVKYTFAILILFYCKVMFIF